MGVTGESRFYEPYPIVLERAMGKWVTDVDGNVYLDYHGALGCAILGYAHPEVEEAVKQSIRTSGMILGAPHPYEARLAERLCDLIPGADRVALFGGGGSDAIQQAVRIARAATGRTKIVKVEGGYQGWHSDVAVSTAPKIGPSPSPGPPEPIPNSAGVLEAVTSEVLVVTVNDVEALRVLFERAGEEIAAVLIEPVLYSAGCIPVEREYLVACRELTSAHGAVLVFDEIMTGFRNGVEGAGARLGIKPDLGAFGKAVANGHVMSFLAGADSVLRELAPRGPVFYSGTFNGHSTSIAAAEATITVLQRDSVPEQIGRLGNRVADGINDIVSSLRVPAACQAVGSVWSMYFGIRSVRDYRDFARCSTPELADVNRRFHEHLLQNGIYMLRRHMNRCFVSSQHTEADIDRTITAVGEFLESHAERLIENEVTSTAGVRM
jgi:glutamate-1-semialdehyde 2,1-aminomutase